MIKRNIYGQIILIKRLLMTVIGLLTYPVFRLFFNIQIQGTGHLKELPMKNVLFVSNHHTYFMDVILMYHAFSSEKRGYGGKIKNPFYIFFPYTNIYYIAAAETMKSGLIPRIFAYTGSIAVKRTWKEGQKEVMRKVDPKDIRKIGMGLQEGWVITFPQGTTRPNAPGRIGTALLIQKFKPIIVPVVISGLREAFNKTGLRIKKTGITLGLKVKNPLSIDYSAPAKEILKMIMEAIEEA